MIFTCVLCCVFRTFGGQQQEFHWLWGASRTIIYRISADIWLKTKGYESLPTRTHIKNIIIIISSLTSLLFLLILHRSHCGIFLEFPFANVVVVCQLLLLVCSMHTQKLVLNRGKLELAFGVRHTSVTRTRPTVHTHTSEFSSHILCRRTCTYAKALGKLSWPPFERP